MANTIRLRRGSTTPTAGSFLEGEPAWDSTNSKLYIKNAAGTMVQINSSGGGAYTFSATAPSSPASGDQWTDSDDGITYQYVNDGTSSQWVELGPVGISAATAFSSGSVTAPSVAIGTGTTYTPGIYSSGTDKFNVTVNGVSQLSIDSNLCDARASIGAQAAYLSNTYTRSDMISYGYSVDGQININDINAARATFLAFPDPNSGDLAGGELILGSVRGTLASPSAITLGDTLGSLVFSGAVNQAGNYYPYRAGGFEAFADSVDTINSTVLAKILCVATNFEFFDPDATSTVEVRFLESATNGGNYVGFKAPLSISTNTIWTLPASDGSSGQTLSTNGLGQLSWSTPVSLSANNTFTGSNSFINSSGQTFRNTNTGDGIAIAGGSSGSSSYSLTLSPAALTGNQSITFPNRTGTVITDGDTGTVTSQMIANSTIVDADISTSAAIAYSKLATLTAGNIVLGNASNVATSTAVTGDVTISNAGVTAISSGVIVNADINASAAIAYSKLASLTAGNIVLGNATNVATSTAVTGDVAITSAGVTTVVSGSTTVAGKLQLTDSISSTSTTTAATPNSVKTAYDLANAAMPKSGGTFTGTINLVAGTTTLEPLQFASGTNLTTPLAGAMEYDGSVGYFTPDTTIGRGFIPATQTFRLTNAGGAIGSTITNFFGTNSNIPLIANAFYEIEIYMLALRGSTAGPATITLTNSATPTRMFVDYEASPLAGAPAPPGSVAALTNLYFRGTTTTTTAAYAITTGTLAINVNHYFRLKLFLQNGTGTSLKIQMTAGTGNNTMTPQAGSVWFCRRLPDANTGTFAA